MPWNATAFGDRLSERSKATKKTLKEAAEFCGLKSASSLSDYARGDSSPSPQVIDKLAEFYDITPAFLAFGDDHEPMDDEELELVEYWRKFDAPERR